MFKAKARLGRSCGASQNSLKQKLVWVGLAERAKIFINQACLGRSCGASQDSLNKSSFWVGLAERAKMFKAKARLGRVGLMERTKIV